MDYGKVVVMQQQNTNNNNLNLHNRIYSANYSKESNINKHLSNDANPYSYNNDYKYYNARLHSEKKNKIQNYINKSNRLDIPVIPPRVPITPMNNIKRPINLMYFDESNV